MLQSAANGSVTARLCRITRSVFAIGVLLGVATACGTTALAGSSGRLSNRNVRFMQHVRLEPLTRSEGSPSLPQGFHLAAMVGDPASRGLWVAASNGRNLTLFHWMPSDRALKSWRLGGAQVAGPLGLSSLAVSDGDDAVWFGANTHIARVLPAKNTVTWFPAPRETPSLAAQEMTPPALRKFHRIVGLAAEGNSSVAVAEEATNVVDVVDASGTVKDSVPLPSNTAPIALASDAQGALGVPLLTYPGALANKFLTYSGGKTKTMSIQAGFVRGGDGMLLTGVSSNLNLTKVYPSSSDAQRVSIATPPSSGPYRALVGAAPIQLQGGFTAYGTASGIAVVNPTGQSTTEYSLPMFSCSYQSGASVGFATTPPAVTPASCHSVPATMAADATGDLWYESSDPAGDLGEITPAMYQPQS